MKKVIYILIIILNFSCQENVRESNKIIKKEKLFIPTLENVFPDSLIVSINVEKYHKYEKLIEEIDSISCTEKIPFVEIETDSTIFNLLAYHICSEEHLIADYKTRNIIGVNNDSIFINKNLEFSIDSLDTILKKEGVK